MPRGAPGLTELFCEIAKLIREGSCPRTGTLPLPVTSLLPS